MCPCGSQYYSSPTAPTPISSLPQAALLRMDWIWRGQAVLQQSRSTGWRGPPAGRSLSRCVSARERHVPIPEAGRPDDRLRPRHRPRPPSSTGWATDSQPSGRDSTRAGLSSACAPRPSGHNFSHDLATLSPPRLPGPPPLPTAGAGAASSLLDCL
jgi:hypothetical protein